MLDSDLATLYGVEVRVLNQAVKRNTERFPEDFAFQLSKQEARQILRSQTVILRSKEADLSVEAKPGLRSQVVILKHGAHRKYLPYAFTEQGVAMLSSVLRSPRAVQVNIEIMRTFVRLRKWLASNTELAQRLDKLEQSYDKKFRVVFEAIRELMREKTAPRRKREIGFHAAPVAPAKSIAKVQQRISV